MATLDEKELYLQASELCRHYLAWREKLFAGYLVVIAALAVAIKEPREPVYFASGIAILGALLTIVFWLLERRNRALFLACVEAGVALEGNASGPFTMLNKVETGWKTPSHSGVISTFYAVAILALVAIAWTLRPH